MFKFELLDSRRQYNINYVARNYNFQDYCWIVLRFQLHSIVGEHWRDSTNNLFSVQNRRISQTTEFKKKLSKKEITWSDKSGSHEHTWKLDFLFGGKTYIGEYLKVSRWTELFMRSNDLAHVQSSNMYMYHTGFLVIPLTTLYDEEIDHPALTEQKNPFEYIVAPSLNGVRTIFEICFEVLIFVPQNFRSSSFIST